MKKLMLIASVMLLLAACEFDDVKIGTDEPDFPGDRQHAPDNKNESTYFIGTDEPDFPGD